MDRILAAMKGEKGAALITAMLFLVLLTTLGLAAIITSSTEINISRNDYVAKKVLYGADAGVQEAMARLDHTSLSPAPNGNKNWSASFEGDAGGVHYLVTVRYKIERSYEDGKHVCALDNQTTIVRYTETFNYSSPIDGGGNATAGAPVYTVESTGSLNGASATVVVDVTENTLNVFVPCGVYSNVCLNIGGNAHIDGGTEPSVITNCPSGVPADDAPYLSGEPWEGGFFNMTGADGFIGVDMDYLRGVAKWNNTYFKETSPNHWDPAYGDPSARFPFGDYTNEINPKIVFIDGDIHISGNTQNYGILIVTGDVTVTGTFDWKGMVYVLGDLTCGAGTINVDGGTMVNGKTETTITGTADLSHDGDILNKLSEQGFKQKVIGWFKWH